MRQEGHPYSIVVIPLDEAEILVPGAVGLKLRCNNGVTVV
jgi:hypothetical protein